MNWAWLFERGWIKGDVTKYENNELGPADIAHAIKVAYNAIDNDEDRKKFVDMAWSSGQNMSGNKEYWYTARPNEVNNLAQAYSGFTGDTNQALKDYNDADPDSRFLGIAGKPEIWKDTDTGQMFVVHFASGVEPPVPLLYEVNDMKTMQAFFGEGVAVAFDREFSAAQLGSTGAVRFGTSSNLDDSEGDPWLGFLDRVERLKEVSPWVADDEILALLGGAYLEDREIEEWELKTTDWWQTHNEAERDWLSMSLGDPASAARKINDDQLYVTNLFEKIGAEGNDPAIINWMGNQFTTGAWSEGYLIEQVEALTSGWGAVDADLDNFMSSSGFESASSQQNFASVKELWSKWLGPAYPPSDDEVAKWATTIRNSADGQDELVEMLKGQRMALYSMYENPELSYQDIAGPWKNLAFNTWGQAVDETSNMFQEIVRMNDYSMASATLRKEGLAQNNGKVWEDATNALRDQTGNVRRAI